MAAVTRLPSLDKLLFVVFQFTVEQKLLACPSRSLLRRAVVIPNRVFDSFRSHLDLPELSHEGPLVQFRHHIRRRLTGPEINRQRAALEFLPQFIDTLIDRQNRDRPRPGA